MVLGASHLPAGVNHTRCGSGTLCPSPRAHSVLRFQLVKHRQ